MILEIKNLNKAFGGLKAVNDVNMEIEKGSIHAVIGPNGAGKTTFFNCITSINPSNSGEVLWKGEDIAKLSTHIISTRGISRTFQNIRLFSYMSVLDNVLVGTHNLTKSFIVDAFLHSKRFKTEEKDMRDFGLELLKKVGLEEKAGEYARNLPYGEQRKLEIARAMGSKPEILLLDEPAAGMNSQETAELVNFIRQLKNEGFTVLLIEHDMKLVMSLADKISVLDHGSKIAEGVASEIQCNERVIEAYLGKRRYE
ncbi:MAG: ABC transporter ATP-binding protein [Spirochaetales bacterium]|nr:ABC transporter ATP-binding protein [Spirochaetales bacterium]